MTTVPPTKELILIALVFVIFSKPCDCIGSWGKKTTTSENDKANDGSSSSIEIDANMEKTYLDLFGESAKEFLTQKAPEKLRNVFPATEEDCRWDWRYVRCEPYCECSFQPKFPGDFHLGRACRKRSHLGESFDHSEIGNVLFETFDEIYREYCVMETNGDLKMHRETPPPPSIPSPFPFLAKSGKTTWNILRTKADPVLEKAVGEFEILHNRVQSVVCQDLKTRCDEDEKESSSDDEITNSSASSEFAWQERLFCRDIVRGCSTGMA
eukprot:CAMPEP_0116097510 /NCGR_PEP_ID=MMETSP0327-20121206/10745_1 /TAXON_ID=44447 /ORGANISM="Pseudo-nitzschia delicatissima, Strain B596" /LENGTH=267 /DNA_ID=CAMNT_0003589269 /DNA_START=148 /DNA_END=954 /DNA_ORIENTATION=-